MVSYRPIAYLLDVDNAVLDNDRIQQDLKDHLKRAYGRDASVRYWSILENPFSEPGCRDYLGALRRFRAERPREVELLSLSSYFIDHSFAGRLFPSALEVLQRLNEFGPGVILSDGNVVSGLFDAVDGHVLVCVHKEAALDDVERRFPAEHYVLFGDKLRILAAAKRYWGNRITTVSPRQGRYAHDPRMVGALPPADVTIERIGDLLGFDLTRLWPAPISASSLEQAR